MVESVESAGNAAAAQLTVISRPVLLQGLVLAADAASKRLFAADEYPVQIIGIGLETGSFSESPAMRL